MLGVGSSSTLTLHPVHSEDGTVTSMLDDGVSHAYQAAKRKRDSEPAPAQVGSELYRHWFVVAGKPVPSRFNPSDAEVLEADAEEKRIRTLSGLSLAPRSALSAEYATALDGDSKLAGSGVAGDQNVSALLRLLSPSQTSFLQCVGAALRSAAGGTAPWLPAWGAPSVSPASSKGAWGALDATDSRDEGWESKARAAALVLRSLTDVSLVLGPVALMLSDSAAHAGCDGALTACIVSLVTALARAPNVPLDQQLHRLLPALLTAAVGGAGAGKPTQLEAAMEAREGAARALGIIAERYGGTYATLRSRLELLLAKPLNAMLGDQALSTTGVVKLGTTSTVGQGSESAQHAPKPPLSVLYGALAALNAMGAPTARAVVEPLLSQLRGAVTECQEAAKALGATEKTVAMYEASMVMHALETAEALVQGTVPTALSKPSMPALPLPPTVPERSAHTGQPAASASLPVAAPPADHQTQPAAESTEAEDVQLEAADDAAREVPAMLEPETPLEGMDDDEAVLDL